MSAIGIGKLCLGVAGTTAVVALIAGCGSSSSGAKTGAGGGGSSNLKSRSTSIGTVLVDGSGHTVYELVGDTAGHQTCTGGCLAIWPAVENNGTQVIVNGHPAFTYVRDTSAGQTNGQNLKDQWGLWLALDASGNPIAASSKTPATPASSTKAKAPSGGGPAF